jgi:hypothetical protein
MFTSNNEFFTCIPKLESDGSNWVIFKDCFLYVADAVSLKPHIVRRYSLCPTLGMLSPCLLYTYSMYCTHATYPILHSHLLVILVVSPTLLSHMTLLFLLSMTHPTP